MKRFVARFQMNAVRVVEGTGVHFFGRHLDPTAERLVPSYEPAKENIDRIDSSASSYKMYV